MATRLFLHAAANTKAGTYPAGEQSGLAPAYTATGGTTIRTLNSLTGVAQTSLVGTSVAATGIQSGLFGMFSSPFFAATQSVGGAGETITLNIANSESNLSMNLGQDLRAEIYVWRPSTNTKVGTVVDGLTFPLVGDAEPSTTAERVNRGTLTSSVSVVALAGDVLICEIWQVHTQAVATAFTGTVFYDGTTVNITQDALVTNHAAFLDFSTTTMTFANQSVTGSYNQSMATVGLITVGTVKVTASLSAATMATLALTTAGAVKVTASLSAATLATLALSGVGTNKVTGTLNSALDSILLNGAGVILVSRTASFNQSMATLALTTVGGVKVTASLSSASMADITFSGVGGVRDTGTLNSTLNAATLVGAGGVVITGSFNSPLATIQLSTQGSATATAVAPVALYDPSAGSGGHKTRKKFVIPEPIRERTLDDIYDDVPPPIVLKQVVVEAEPPTLVSKPPVEEYSDEDLIMLLLLAI